MNYANPRSTGRSARSFSALAVVALATLATTGSPAHAGTDDDLPTVDVHYNDLNLAGDKGVARLYQRLRTASRIVCDGIDQREPARKAKWRPCYEHALTAAVLDVNEPGLSALHSIRSGTRGPAVDRTARTTPR